MIKILSFKTRRPDLTTAAFRSHYEQRHVPLGLSFIEHFRWRRYLRNHVVGCLSGNVDFDCLTEFWIASRSDQARTAAFVATPGFSILDEDDHRFLDVSRRLSFEVEEHILATPERPIPSAGSGRLSMLFEKPAEMSPTHFDAEVGELSSTFATRQRGSGRRITLDVRQTRSPAERARDEGLETSGVHAILSVWPAEDPTSRDPSWPETTLPTHIVRLESIETPAHRLYQE